MLFEELMKLNKECHQIALEHGWWGNDITKPTRNFGEGIALMHSEIVEAYEAWEEKDQAHVNEELADVYIRWADFIGGFKINYVSPENITDAGIEYANGFETFTNLMHNSLSRALEAYRHQKDNVVSYNLSELIVLITDYCEKNKIDFIDVVKMKMDINRNRPYRHGKIL
jgi:NTP pyrophosphatase (non-canonical NTP hydrolase)